MTKNIIGGLLSFIFVVGFTFNMPDISRMFTMSFSMPGPHFTPGPNEPLGPFPTIEFSHPHFTPGPNEPLGPFPPELTPLHCPPGPNEPLGPHFMTNHTMRSFAVTIPEEPKQPTNNCLYQEL